MNHTSTFLSALLVELGTHRHLHSRILVALVCGGLALSSSTSANEATIVIDGRANIFGAGKLVPPSPGGGGGGVLPPEFSFAAGPNQIVRFSSVTGGVTVAPCPGCFVYGPDGSGGAPPSDRHADVSSFGGISGIIHDDKVQFLVGVFLDNATPADPAPPRLDVTVDSFDSVSPLISQTFLIGDGLTDTGTGSVQDFNVPASATRLFLGFVDARGHVGWPGYFDDNGGSLTATFKIGPAFDRLEIETASLKFLHPGWDRFHFSAEFDLRAHSTITT